MHDLSGSAISNKSNEHVRYGRKHAERPPAIYISIKTACISISCRCHIAHNGLHHSWLLLVPRSAPACSAALQGRRRNCSCQRHYHDVSSYKARAHSWCHYLVRSSARGTSCAFAENISQSHQEHVSNDLRPWHLRLHTAQHTTFAPQK